MLGLKLNHFSTRGSTSHEIEEPRVIGLKLSDRFEIWQTLDNTDAEAHIKFQSKTMMLTHWGRVTHTYVDKPTIIGSDNGLLPERRQAIIWTNAGILLIGPLGTNFSEILIEIQTFSLTKIRLEMSSAKCCSFRRGLNVLTP